MASPGCFCAFYALVMRNDTGAKYFSEECRWHRTLSLLFSLDHLKNQAYDSRILKPTNLISVNLLLENKPNSVKTFLMEAPPGTKNETVIREFIETKVMPHCYDWNEAKAIPREMIKRAAELGILNCTSGGFIWALMGGLDIGLPLVLNFGSPELCQKVVPDCLVGDHYLVNGQKKWITQGLFSDYYTVAYRTGRSMEGVEAGAMDVQGMWGSGTSYITFEDVKVSKDHVIGKVNQGFKYIMHNFNHEHLGIVMQANRLACVCIEKSLKRKTFDQRLVKYVVFRKKFGHMIRQVEATHTWLKSVLCQLHTLPDEVTPNLIGGLIALLKAQSTQTFEFCGREAAQFFGGLAYTQGGQGEKIERLYRKVRAYAIPGGSEEIMLNLGDRQALKQAFDAVNKHKL
ncbi:MAG: acyl-CoA dehydrogenase/oxidase [Benjaminiella poitrasii]|nr:MAG: acyl-CoA dehydrogenase/oxidase [Benjaminiella poitrasii]